MSYGRSYGRRSAQHTGPRPNKYDGGCDTCKRLVPAGTGVLTGNRSSGYVIRHEAARWVGSPVSGRWVGGCDDAKDQPVYAPRQASPDADLRAVSRRAGSKYAYSSSGARMTMSSRRCEDAPCCGCCDLGRNALRRVGP